MMKGIFSILAIWFICTAIFGNFAGIVIAILAIVFIAIMILSETPDNNKNVSAAGGVDHRILAGKEVVESLQKAVDESKNIDTYISSVSYANYRNDVKKSLEEMEVKCRACEQEYTIINKLLSTIKE